MLLGCIPCALDPNSQTPKPKPLTLLDEGLGHSPCIEPQGTVGLLQVAGDVGCRLKTTNKETYILEASIYIYIWIDTHTETQRQTDRQTETETETERQTDRQTQTHRQTDRQRRADRQTDVHPHPRACTNTSKRLSLHVVQKNIVD